MTFDRPLRVVVAPDSFKGSLPAIRVAECIEEGWSTVRPDDRIESIPQADGGEGTVAAVARHYPRARLHRVPGITGPDGRPVFGEWLLLPDDTAVIELAQMSGLPLMGGELDPGGATTYGLGQVISAALDAGAKRIVVGLGGSASTDGGAGMLSALGAVLTDSTGCRLPFGGLGLAVLEKVDMHEMRPLPARGVEVLTDTTAPLFGPTGAASVFGPQKGASPAMVASLDAALARFADRVGRIDPSVPGTGAAGGTGFGLLAWGASLVSGAEAVADLTGLSEAITRVEVVITGEGRYDDTSSAGKLVGSMLNRCRKHDVRSVVIAGQLCASPPEIAVSLTDMAGSVQAALSDPEYWISIAASVAAQRFQDQFSSETQLDM